MFDALHASTSGGTRVRAASVSSLFTASLIDVAFVNNSLWTYSTAVGADTLAYLGGGAVFIGGGQRASVELRDCEFSGYFANVSSPDSSALACGGAVCVVIGTC
jgi:hypothetical protein